MFKYHVIIKRPENVRNWHESPFRQFLIDPDVPGDNEYWIETTGKGGCRVGTKIGKVFAKTPEQACQQLINSGQAGLTWPKNWNYIQIDKTAYSVLYQPTIGAGSGAFKVSFAFEDLYDYFKKEFCNV